MFWHWQNLNNKAGGRQGSGLRHGRAWLHFGERNVIGIEWSFGGFRCGIGVMQHGDGLSFSVDVPLLFTLAITVELRALRHFCERYHHHQLSLSVHDRAIWWNLWVDWTGCKRCSQWRNTGWYPLDTILGRSTYSERTISETRTVIPMPEGAYPATVRLFESKWSRARWFPRYMVRADTKPDIPIPVPGKGENSWDCGDSFISSSTTPAKTVEGAVADYVELCLRDRRCYAGPDWKPEKGWPLPTTVEVA